MSRYPKIEFNRLKMYFGDDYEIDLEGLRGKIVVRCPVMDALIECGDDAFQRTLNIFVQNGSSARLMLWESGIDWNKISDFELFCLMYKTIDPEMSKYFFGQMNWENFKLFNYSKENGEQELRLLNEEDDVEINQDVYEHIHQYFQNMFRIFPEDEFTDNTMLKKLWIRKDRIALEQSKKKSVHKAPLLSQISAYLNHPGTKYNAAELRNVPVSQFFDSVERLRIYEHSTALLKGMFSGMMDSSKIKAEEYDFMKDVSR